MARRPATARAGRLGEQVAHLAEAPADPAPGRALVRAAPQIQPRQAAPRRRRRRHRHRRRREADERDGRTYGVTKWIARCHPTRGPRWQSWRSGFCTVRSGLFGAEAGSKAQLHYPHTRLSVPTALWLATATGHADDAEVAERAVQRRVQRAERGLARAPCQPRHHARGAAGWAGGWHDASRWRRRAVKVRDPSQLVKATFLCGSCAATTASEWVAQRWRWRRRGRC